MGNKSNMTNIDYDRRFIRRLMREGLLEREEEFALARAWRERQDERALHRLITAYERLVVSVATRFHHYGLPISDLIQEGNIGIMQAANRFDAKREIRFSTYATWWIRAAMQDYVLRNWSIVRTGTSSAQKSLFFKLKRLRARIGEAEGGALTEQGRQQIAESIGVSVRDVEDMEMRLSGGDASLNAEVGEGTARASFQDLLVDENPTPEQFTLARAETAQIQKWLHEALADLSDRERMIVIQRRLRAENVTPKNPKTLEQLGDDWGISKERVRQIEARAFDKIRHHLTARATNKRDLPFLN